MVMRTVQGGNRGRYREARPTSGILPHGYGKVAGSGVGKIVTGGVIAGG